MRYVAWAVGLALAALAGLWMAGWRPPYRYNPWAPMDLQAPPGPFLGVRLYRLNRDPAQCLRALAQSPPGNGLEAIVTTELGTFRFEFAGDKAPKHVDQFLGRTGRGGQGHPVDPGRA